MVMYRKENGVDIQLTAQEEAAVIARVKAEEEEQIELAKTQYQRDRKAEYPSIEDVTVALAEKAEGNSTMWDEITLKRQAVKTKYPKE